MSHEQLVFRHSRLPFSVLLLLTSPYALSRCTLYLATLFRPCLADDTTATGYFMDRLTLITLVCSSNNREVLYLRLPDLHAPWIGTFRLSSSLHSASDHCTVSSRLLASF